MLIFDKQQIGSRLLAIRKKAGLTQAEVAEKSGMADRTYADIERGEANMRVDTMLRLCKTLNVLPNDIFTVDDEEDFSFEEIQLRFAALSPGERKTAARLVSVYLQSLSTAED